MVDVGIEPIRRSLGFEEKVSRGEGDRSMTYVMSLAETGRILRLNRQVPLPIGLHFPKAKLISPTRFQISNKISSLFFLHRIVSIHYHLVMSFTKHGSSLVASTSRTTVQTRVTVPSGSRPYASAPQNPNVYVPSDTRIETIRRTLYPANSFTPNSASPTGSHHPQHLERLKVAIPSVEVYETIERAYKLFQREKRKKKESELSAKMESMRKACDELDRMTGGDGSGGVEEGKGLMGRAVYERAMARPAQSSLQGLTRSGKPTPESRFREARIQGLIPREAWVPTETRGKGWNYGWQRPGQ